MSKIKVLLVDDEVELLQALSERLELRGFEVAVANCGEKALAILEGAEPDEDSGDHPHGTRVGKGPRDGHAFGGFRLSPEAGGYRGAGIHPQAGGSLGVMRFSVQHSR